ncbi:type I glyceraldehyde-3-phosphate dehydrogenase [Thermodesulfovibrio sp. 3907-1M]|uniref:Type I glyceraldehyde-3-phosphate dehydrogenase n=1 Tax=Thermodesulfovibrio autotrophicus TaxID=3118333 RepID=A0AAU8GXM7_9BACT
MRVAINGFGRIGRLVTRIFFDENPGNIDLVAVNSSKNTEMLAYLLKHDSVYGEFNKEVSYDSDFIMVSGKKIKIIEERQDLTKLPWKELEIDLVVEATGKFKKKEDAYKHIEAGAKRVIITAPSTEADIMVVYGINHDIIKPEHRIISAASCTTNCVAPVCKVLEEFEILDGFITTVHAYTSDQRLLDGTHKKDMRRARAAALNIVPTSTGVGKALSYIFPHLEGKISATSIRVPVPTGSIVDFSVRLQKNPSLEEIKEKFIYYENNSLKNVLKYTEEPVVSTDIIGMKYSSIVDGLLSSKTGDIYKIFSWYDNEYGYSFRIVDLIKFLAKGG